MRSDGYGFGDGDGFGYGYGYSDGSGHGHGYGHGYGGGYGDGHKGWGRVLGTVRVPGRCKGLQVRHLAPWPYVAVGCQAHSVAYWRKHWEEIAEAEDVDITTTAVQKIFALLNEEK